MFMALFCCFLCVASGENYSLKNNQKKQFFITDQAEFFRKLTNPSLQIVDWHILSEDIWSCLNLNTKMNLCLKR